MQAAITRLSIIYCALYFIAILVSPVSKSTTISKARTEMKLINNEIRDVLIDHRTEIAFHEGKPHLFVDHELTAITTITGLLSTIELVANSKSTLFKVAFRSNSKTLGFSNLGRRFFFEIQGYFQWVTDRMMMYKLSPALTFVQNKFAFLILEGSMSQAFRLEDQSIDNFVIKLNMAVEGVRIYLSSSQYKRDVNNYTRSSRKNYASLRKLVQRLFQNHSRLLVIRTDLGYRSVSDILGCKPIYIESSQAIAHRNYFLKALKNKYPALKGYAWCMEYGVMRGFHFHAIFFMDSRSCPWDINIAQDICDMWNGPVTQGHGFAYNCNAVKSRYKSCGIGIIDHFNKEGMAGLMKALRYLTKPDEVMKLQIAGGIRCFGRSPIPPLKTETRGRKRKNS